MGCCDWPNNVSVILVVVVGVTIVEIHVPRVVTVVLRDTPMVTAILRLCIFVTEGVVSRSKAPIQPIM